MPFGLVDETKPGYVKVSFGGEDYKTDWIPVGTPLAYGSAAQFVMKKGTQVFVVQERSSDGEVITECCIAATFNEMDTAPFDSNNQHGYNLEDTETLILHGNETNAVRFDELEDALNEIKGVVNDLITEYKQHTHLGVTIGSGTSGVPATAAAFLKSVTKIMSLVKSTFIKLR